MLFDTKGYRLFLRPGHVDFRKGSHALAQLVEQEMELSPFDKCMFLFCSRERRTVRTPNKKFCRTPLTATTI